MKQNTQNTFVTNKVEKTLPIVKIYNREYFNFFLKTLIQSQIR